MNIQIIIIVKCGECGYEASSETVLKRHKTSKHNEHNEHNPTPEKETSTEHDTSLQLLKSVDERAEVLYSPPQPHDKDHIQTEEKTVLQFKCELCSFASVCSANLQSHLSFTHNPSIPHTSEWDYNKCYICNQVFNTSEFFKNHMIELHNFSDDSNVFTKCFEPTLWQTRTMQYRRRLTGRLKWPGGLWKFWSSSIPHQRGRVIAL